MSVTRTRPLVARRWDFDQRDDREGWTVSTAGRGTVEGGALWLALTPPPEQPLQDSERDPALALSPAGLEIPTADITQVRLRVLNRSPLTDLFVLWRTKEQGWGPQPGPYPDPAWGRPEQCRRFPMEPYRGDWQEVICEVGARWQGTLDQIAIRTFSHAPYGDLWVDWVEIGTGPSLPARPRPDVMSSHVVPRITLPEISQSGFEEAFRVLDYCLEVDVPLGGFPVPFMTPGGHYRNGGWFFWDQSLEIAGTKWVNHAFVEDVMRGFRAVQALNPDGRIDIGGGNNSRPGDLSVFPSYFDAAYDVARRTASADLRAEIYASMSDYLDWWMAPPKRDPETGLIWAVFEETFFDRLQHPYLNGPDWSYGLAPMLVAPIDLNVGVAVGAARAAQLADALGRRGDAQRHRRAFRELARAINDHLWMESEGIYGSWDLRDRELHREHTVTMFDTLRVGLAPAIRRRRLLKRLTDPKQFNWGRRPLTTWAMTEPAFVDAHGDVDPGAFFGGIWVYQNALVVAGLKECGYFEEAAQLNWDTIKVFHGQYREYVTASTGMGHGALDYGAAASQYISSIVDHLFGVDVDLIEERIQIVPMIPVALRGQDLSIENLVLPNDPRARLALQVCQETATRATIKATFSGPLPKLPLRLAIPGTDRELVVPARRVVTANLR